MQISSFRTIDGSPDVDLDAEPGTTFSLTATSTVTIIDPFEEYVEVLKSCFDFDAIKEFAKRPGFSILFDGMHGAGGPFARRVLVEELGFPEVSMPLVWRHLTIRSTTPLCCRCCSDSVMWQEILTRSCASNTNPRSQH
jgi:phosphoglucomutase